MSEDGLISFLLFFSLEKWLKRLIYYQNGCQIISWPSIMNWFIGAALVKTPGLILAGAVLLSCPVPPTEPVPLPVMGWGSGSWCESGETLSALAIFCPGGFDVDVHSVLMYGLYAETALCSQQIIVARSCCSFRFIPCRRPPAAIKSHPQISVSIIFSSPPSFIPYKVGVWALCFLPLFYLAAVTVLWTRIIPDYT